MDDHEIENTNNMTPLAAIVEAFEEMAEIVKDSKEELRLKAFSDACALVSVLFDSLGIAFKFAEIEYCAKVQGLVEASKKYATLQNVIEVDVKNDSVKSPGSLSRNLRRVRQGLDLIRAFDCSLREAASTAYSQTCAPYHSWAVRAAVAAGMYALLSRDQLLLKLNETDQSAEKRMRRYMKASLPVIQYIDRLYTSRNISLDW
ncbi:ACD11 homolog protein-like protein [Drosera capensis]